MPSGLGVEWSANHAVTWPTTRRKYCLRCAVPAEAGMGSDSCGVRSVIQISSLASRVRAQGPISRNNDINNMLKRGEACEKLLTDHLSQAFDVSMRADKFSFLVINGAIPHCCGVCDI